ncbi:MAG: LamG domain-containing protein [Pseudomonadota bacterium]
MIRLRSLLLLCLTVPASVFAAPGDVLFSDDFEGNLSQWTVTDSGGEAFIDDFTSQSGDSLTLRWDPVTVTSDAFDATVPAVRLEAWVRRGSDSFSEDPDSNEDLVFEYLNDVGAWISVASYPGQDTPGEILNLNVVLPNDALHSALRVRVRMTGGSGSDFDYWHVDDVSVTEDLPVGPWGLGACMDFESGLGDFTITSSGGDAGINSDTSNSGSFSVFTRWDPVTVTSPAVSLAGASGVELSAWIRRGSDSFSENPDNGEDFVVEYLNDGGSWVAIETFTGSGTQGEIFDRVYTLGTDALHAGFQVRFRQTNGSGSDFDYWHLDDVCLSGNQQVSFYFDEEEWTGTAGEVTDSGSGGLSGTAFGGVTTLQSSPAIPGNPGSCRYGDFDGVDDYIEIADDPALDFETALTVGAWINPRSLPSGSGLHTIVAKDENYEYHLNSSGEVFWFWTDESGNNRTLTSSVSLVLNQWYHVAITYESGSQIIYVDGVQVATSSRTGALEVNNDPLRIGSDVNGGNRIFDGFIDEVNIFGRALTQAEVQTLMMETRPCPTVAPQFTINHDGFGINCLAETITVSVVDAAAGTPLTDYNATIVLDTQSGNGSWQLLTGGGALNDATANDGLATYNWPLTESTAVFGLSYSEGATPIDVDVFQQSDVGIRDTDTEGLLAFSPSGFTVTAAALSNPPPGTIVSFADPQVAGTDFSLHIAAFGQTPSDPSCGIIESYNGTQTLDFWADRQNPSIGSVVPTVDTLAIADAEVGSSDQTVTFINGQATVTSKYKDAGEIRISVKDDTPTDPELVGGIRGGTAGFVVRPFEFRVSAIADGGGAANPAATDENGAVFIAAGEAFAATVTAFDAEGDVTPNYGQETVPESVALTVSLVAPVGGNSPPIASPGGFGSFTAGSATGTSFSWPEVGIITLVPAVADGDYLGAGNVTGPASGNVGRFIPHRFDTAINVPVLSTSCSAGSFTYIGEPFDYSTPPVLTFTAKALGGETTSNYSGDFFKMSGVADPVYTALPATLDTSGLLSNGAATIAESGNGIGTLTYSAGTGLSFARSAEQSPFDADIRLSQELVDSDGVAAASNPISFGNPTGILFDGGAEMRYGRLALINAFGSELVDLPIALRSEYYFSDAVGFVPNAADACTVGIDVSIDQFTDNLDLNDTCLLEAGPLSGLLCPLISSPLLTLLNPASAGEFELLLKAPGNGNEGGVRVTANAPAYLEYDWDATSAGDEDPIANATFGIFRGLGRRIYTRELY